MQITQWSDALSGWLMGMGLPGWAAIVLVYAVGSFILINYGMLSVLLLIWITRKVISRMQDRIGPNRVGKYGLLQTVADAAKLLSKEDITPYEADKIAYNLSPILAVSGVSDVAGGNPLCAGTERRGPEYRRPLYCGARLDWHHGCPDGRVGQ